MDEGKKNTKARVSPGRKPSFDEKLQKDPSAKRAFSEKMSDERAAVSSVQRSIATRSKNAEHLYERKKGQKNAALYAVSDKIRLGPEKDQDGDLSEDAVQYSAYVSERMSEGGVSAYSKWRQRHEIKKAYAGSRRASFQDTAKESVKKTAKNAEKAAERMGRTVSEHVHLILLLGGLALTVLLAAGMTQSCLLIFHGLTGMTAETSYVARDEDILGVEEDYACLEEELQDRIGNVQTEYPGFDEYDISADSVGHDPHELAAYLTVLYGAYERSMVQEELRTVFLLQYELTMESEIRTGTRDVPNTAGAPETGSAIETEDGEEEEIRILTVRLENHGLANERLLKNLDDEQLEKFEDLMITQGNRPDLFQKEE